MSDSQSAYSSYHLDDKVVFEGVRSVTAWVAKDGRMVLCYVQGSGRRKRKKSVGCGSGRQENYESERRDCDFLASRLDTWIPSLLAKSLALFEDVDNDLFIFRLCELSKEYDVISD
ncbi:hypothetical protein Tco_0115125 [Tanacetum coccineum]